MFSKEKLDRLGSYFFRSIKNLVYVRANLNSGINSFQTMEVAKFDFLLKKILILKLKILRSF